MGALQVVSWAAGTCPFSPLVASWLSVMQATPGKPGWVPSRHGISHLAKEIGFHFTKPQSGCELFSLLLIGSFVSKAFESAELESAISFCDSSLTIKTMGLYFNYLTSICLSLSHAKNLMSQWHPHNYLFNPHHTYKRLGITIHTFAPMIACLKTGQDAFAALIVLMVYSHSDLQPDRHISLLLEREPPSFITPLPHS